VIATGGSAIYSETAMQHLATIGRIIFLDVPLEELEVRLHDMESRGLVIDPGSSLADLYAERLPLYQRWAELTVDEGGKESRAGGGGSLSPAQYRMLTTTLFPTPKSRQKRPLPQNG